MSLVAVICFAFDAARAACTLADIALTTGRQGMPTCQNFRFCIHCSACVLAQTSCWTDVLFFYRLQPLKAVADTLR